MQILKRRIPREEKLKQLEPRLLEQLFDLLDYGYYDERGFKAAVQLEIQRRKAVPKPQMRRIVVN